MDRQPRDVTLVVETRDGPFGGHDRQETKPRERRATL